MSERRAPCGRPTSKGTPCRSLRMPEWDMPDDYRAPACGQHATQDGRIEYAHLMAITEDRRRTAMDCSPACWSWPALTEADRERVRAENAFLAKYQDGKILEDILPGATLQAWHAGRCAVCGVRQFNLVEDHDHATGLVRGYLCRGCNVREGVYRYSDVRIWREYRERNPASICGVSIRYWNSYTMEYAKPEEPALPPDMDGDDYLLAGLDL